MHYVIIGSGIAGATAIKEIRKRDPHGRITIIAHEKPPFYYRPMIPKLIDDSYRPDDLVLLENPVDKAGATLIAGRCDKISVEHKRLELNSGDTVSFDKLLLATGARATMPNVSGTGSGPSTTVSGASTLKKKGVFCLRTMDDALAIRDYAGRCKSSVIIGAGLVGIKACEAFLKLGLAVTIIEQQDQIMIPRVDSTVAAMVSQRLEAKGVRIITGAMVENVVSGENEAVKGVELNNGQKIVTDLVLVATGVKARLDLAEEAGLETRQGVVVDETMQTSSADIFAAGDLVQYQDGLTKKLEMSALWTNAVQMAKVAAANMTGSRTQITCLPAVQNATEILGLPIISTGLVTPPDGGREEIIRQDNETFQKLVYQGNKLVGLLFAGSVDRAGVYTNMIRFRTY